MRAVVRCGVILGTIQAIWWLGVVASGHYMNTALNFWIVLGLELLGMIWLLRITAGEGRGYLRQVVAGTTAFAVVGAFLFVATYVGWAFLAPDYADVAVATARSRALDSGNPPADLEERLRTLHAMYTPIRQSSFVVVGTVATGLIFSAVLAPFIRHRSRAIRE